MKKLRGFRGVLEVLLSPFFFLFTFAAAFAICERMRIQFNGRHLICGRYVPSTHATHSRTPTDDLHTRYFYFWAFAFVVAAIGPWRAYSFPTKHQHSLSFFFYKSISTSLTDLMTIITDLVHFHLYTHAIGIKILLFL